MLDINAKKTPMNLHPCIEPPEADMIGDTLYLKKRPEASAKGKYFYIPYKVDLKRFF